MLWQATPTARVVATGTVIEVSEAVEAVVVSYT